MSSSAFGTPIPFPALTVIRGALQSFYLIMVHICCILIYSRTLHIHNLSPYEVQREHWVSAQMIHHLEQDSTANLLFQPCNI